jgi:hypothetical protein
MSWNLLWKAPLYGLGYPIAFVVSCAVVTACICPVASGYAVIKGATAAWEFIHPSFEDAITCGYKRPIPGLKLCQRCRAVKNSPRRQRVEHHGDLNALKASSQRGCWACQKLCEQYERFVGDGSQPPAPHMEDLISPLLLLWYSKHVTTKSGYLDDLDTKGASIN